MRRTEEMLIDIGSRLELFVDDFLIKETSGEVQLRMHRPIAREVAVENDRSWEGNSCGYVTVFQDDDLYRMYYRGSHAVYTRDGYRSVHRQVTCYAESVDGIHWKKPDLGLFEFDGSKKNNIVWDGLGTHAFVHFKDTNPDCTSDARYKALGFSGPLRSGLYAFKSSDSINWSSLSPDPVITEGAFDSQNLAFWDSVHEEYREYHRDFRNGRDIRTSTSKDFLNWTEPVFLEYLCQAGKEGLKDLPDANHPSGRVSQLYTNQIIPYCRARSITSCFFNRSTFDRRSVALWWVQKEKCSIRWVLKQAFMF